MGACLFFIRTAKEEWFMRSTFTRASPRPGRRWRSCDIASRPCGWSVGIHSPLTRVTVELLPEWEREVITEEKGFVQRYCISPTTPCLTRCISSPSTGIAGPLHIPGSLRNKAVFDAYRLASFHCSRGQYGRSDGYFGCVAHYLEDGAAPCHMANGEIAVPPGEPPLLQMDFFKRFLPVSTKWINRCSMCESTTAG